MHRNPLTPDEERFGRLMQTLDREPPAPDAEFLKALREASTKAFLKAQSSRPQTRRARQAPPPNPVVGRKLLRTLRIAMLSAVAVVLVVGSLPPSLFPSRGAALQVAFNNLRRNNTVEMEVSNGPVSKLLVFSQDDGVERVVVTYPSGKQEVIEPGGAYFVNRDNNSVHASPVELAEVSLNLLQDKVLALMNVNDPQEQSLLLSQRPQSQRTENGHVHNYYHFEAPPASPDGETLTFDATVDATTNSLMALNSRVIDSNGRTQFAANADIKGLNNTIAPERFRVSSNLTASDEIAMVEEVHGNAEVFDLMPQPGAEAGFNESDGRKNWNFDDNSAGVNNNTKGRPSANLEMAGALGGYGGGGGRYANGRGAAPGEAPGLRRLEDTQEKTLSKKLAISEKSEQTAQQPLEPESLKEVSKEAAKEAAEDKAASKLASKPGAAGAQIKADLDDMTEGLKPKKSVDRNRAAKGPPASNDQAAPTDSPSPPAAAAPAVVTAKSRSKDVENAPLPTPKAAPVIDGKQAEMPQKRRAPSEPVDYADAPSQRRSVDTQLKQQMDNPRFSRAGGTNSESKSDPGNAKQLAASETSPPPGAGRVADPDEKQLRPYAAPRLLMPQNSQKQEQLLNQSPYGVAEALKGQQSLESLAYGNNGRQVEAKSPLRPGDLLKTGDDQTDILRARLANDADLIVGPGSEVIVLKPTEIRLRFGDLAVDVPAGDQVDLLWGVEPELQTANNDNNKPSNYKRGYQQRGSLTRRQITGRATLRVVRNQVQELDRQPEWLNRYYADNGKEDSAEPTAESREKQATGPAGKLQLNGNAKARAPQKSPEVQNKQ